MTLSSRFVVDICFWFFGLNPTSHIVTIVSMLTSHAFTARNVVLTHRVVCCDGLPLLGVAGRSMQSEDSYLVDPASSHMLVSKIKPCMSKYKHLIL